MATFDLEDIWDTWFWFFSVSISELLKAKASKWTFGYVWMNSDKKDVEDSPTAPRPLLIVSAPTFTFWCCCLQFYPKPQPLARANANDWFWFSMVHVKTQSSLAQRYLPTHRVPVPSWRCSNVPSESGQLVVRPLQPQQKVYGSLEMWHTSRLVKDGSLPYFTHMNPMDDDMIPVLLFSVAWRNVTGQEAKRRCDL